MWIEVNRNDKKQRFRDFEINKNEKIAIGVASNGAFLFSNEKKALSLQELQQTKTYQKVKIAWRKENFQIYFEEAAFKLLNSAQFIEIKKAIEKLAN